MVIGITGSSGAGKSTVCEILEFEYGVKIINADKLTRRLSKKGSNYLADIVQQFGTEILLENGELNRSKLAETIYSNSEKREQLNKCTFKYIKVEIQKEIERIKNEELEIQKMKAKQANQLNLADSMNEPIIAIDAPLLFEAELDSICNFVIAVISENKLQVQRIMERDLITECQAIARLNAQKANEFYTSKSKYIIVNNGELEEVEKQIEKILKKIKKL